MKRVHGVQALKDRIVIRYSDDEDPPWVWGREADVAWREDPNVRRITHLACHLFLLLLDDPKAVPANEEILQEWVARLFREHSHEN